VLTYFLAPLTSQMTLSAVKSDAFYNWGTNHQVDQICLCIAVGEAIGADSRIPATERREPLRRNGGGLGSAVCSRGGGYKTELRKQTTMWLHDHQGMALTQNNMSNNIECCGCPDVLYHSIHMRDDRRWMLVL
jgi:hypothetical protein